LLNVAFENPRKILGREDSENPKKKGKRSKQVPIQNERKRDIYNVPDRLSGLEELEELRKLCPSRQWNFVEVNIDYAESSQTRSIIQDVMFPSRTVMDLVYVYVSIACTALMSPCRVLQWHYTLRHEELVR